MISLTRLDPAKSLFQPEGLDWEKNGVFNPGVTIFDNKILLLYRAVGEDNISRFGVATSSDGIHFSRQSPVPSFSPDPATHYEERGVEDPRISFLDGKYAIVYVAASINITTLRPDATDWKTRISLAWTTDFKKFDRHGVIVHSYNDKDAALFPQKYNGNFYLYHRRFPSIWLSKSLDLNTWEDVCTDNCLIVNPDKSNWDNDRIGIGSQPILTDIGWLNFYHGRDSKGIYRLGAFIADLEHPEIIIAKLPYPILEPVLPFEIEGKVQNVVFSCGAVEAGGYYWVYYGGADYAIGGAYVKKQELLDELKRYTR